MFYWRLDSETGCYSLCVFVKVSFNPVNRKVSEVMSGKNVETPVSVHEILRPVGGNVRNYARRLWRLSFGSGSFRRRTCPACQALLHRQAHPPDPYLTAAMDYIIHELRWAKHFPSSVHTRIFAVCEAVKERKPLPFLKP